MPRQIPVTHRDESYAPYFAIVDDGDFLELSKFNWRPFRAKTGPVYAYTTINRKNVFMHRMVMDLTKGGPKVDHKNRIGLDNRRDNLRLASTSQNTQNSKKYSGMTSQYKGVSYVPPNEKIKRKNPGWRAIIYIPQQLNLGSFKTEEEAARAYDEAALEYFGEFALINFQDAKQ